ncbi:MAG: S8 family peptidase [Candidatus Njordarchaeia archaeon]
MKKLIGFIIIILFLVPTAYPFMGHETNTTKGDYGKTVNVTSLQGSALRNTIIVFKDLNALRYVKSSLKDKIVSFDPIPIAYVTASLNNAEKRLLLKYKSSILSVYQNRVYKLEKLGPVRDYEPTSETTLSTINATVLHENGIKGKGIKVAIIDTGIWEHPDLKGRIVASKSFIKKEYGYPDDVTSTDDDIGHGTSVAGVAAGDGSKDSKYIGVAPEASLINAKVFYKGAEGEVATDAGIIAAIRWVVLEENADVINLSIGGAARLNDPLVKAVNWAVSMGVVVVTAAGNEGDYYRGSMQISTPAVSKYVISVGATGSKGKYIRYYSSVGPIYDMSVKPDVIAPGSVIAPVKSNLGKYYDNVEGTSFSSPHVAGAVALLLQAVNESNITFENELQKVALIKTALMSTAKSIEAPDIAEGAGLINVGEAWKKIVDYWDNNHKVPDFFSVLPKKLPAGLSFPWRESIFTGMRLEFNITFYTSINRTINLTVSGNVSDIISKALPDSPLEVRYPFTNFELLIHVPDNATTGYYDGNISIQENSKTLATIPINFYLKIPKAYMLFDLRHTSWIMDAKYGQYRHFYELAENMGIAVEQWYWGDPKLNSSILSKYDLVFMSDTASYYETYDDNGVSLGLVSKGISKDEQLALKNYVETGGALIFVSMLPVEQDTGNNITNVNEFSSEFGVEFQKQLLVKGSQPIAAKVLSDSFFGLGGQMVPYLGTYLKISENDPQLEKLMIVDLYGKEYPVASVYLSSGGGFILFSATNFYFDNWSFEGAYGVALNEALNVRSVHEAILSNIIYKKNILINSMTSHPTLGSKVDVNVTIINISYTNIEVYYRDRIGAVKLKSEGQIGPHSFQYSFYPRHARDVSIIVKIVTSSGNVTRVKMIYIEPTESNPPTLLSMSPANGSTLVTNLYENNYLEFNLTVSDDSGLLPSITEVKAYVEEYGEIPVEFTVEANANNKTINIYITVSKRDIINVVFFTTKLNLILSVKVYDVNINELSLLEVYEIKHYKPLGIFDVISVVLIVFTLLLVIGILYNHRKQKRENLMGTY